MVLTFGSLFAGIGGIDLGLERAGMKCVWQVEIDDYARRVLAKHWLDVQRWDDVRTFPPEGDWNVDLICGGFPCQDISNAGKRAGIEGERSGLWSEFARIVRVLRPRYVLVENVAALLGRGLGRVLGDLAQCGYDAEWDCLPAAAFGALHIRNRVFLLAYLSRIQQGRQDQWAERERTGQGCESAATNSVSERLAIGTCERSHAQTEQSAAERSDYQDGYDSIIGRHWTPEETVFAGRRSLELPSGWKPEPSVGRVANGVPHRVDRLRGLGNAVVPQVAEWIGRQLLSCLESPLP